MSKKFAVLAAAAAFVALSSTAFAATPDAAPPGYVTWSDTQAPAHATHAVQRDQHMSQAPAFTSDPYGYSALDTARGV